MNDKKTLKPATPPYVSYSTFLNFLADMKTTGVPNQIDRSALPTMSGGIFNQLMPTIRYLGLVDASGRSKPILQELVDAEGEARNKIYSDILKEAYKFLFLDFGLMGATPKTLEERFRTNGATGETTRKCITFFLKAANDADIELGTRINIKTRHRKPRTPIAGRKWDKGDKQGGGKSSLPPPPREPDRDGDSYSGYWYDKLKTFIEELPLDHNRHWTKAKRDAWLNAVTSLLDMLIETKNENT